MARPKKISDTEETNDVLDRAVAEIKAKWGSGAIHVPGEVDEKMTKETVDTGVPKLNEVLGYGGLAKGTIVEIYGSEGSGKTTLCLQIVASAQKQGLKTVFIDQEQSLVPRYASQLGVDLDSLYLAQPESLEQALSIVESLVRTGEIGMVVIDSLASLVPEAELDKEIGEQTMGLQPKAMSAWFRRFNPVINKTGTIIMFTNQLREKLGGYGNPEFTPGGRAMKFYASYRIEVKVKEKIKDQGVVTGTKLELTMVKNKFSRPYQVASVEMKFGEGVDILSCYIDSAVDAGIISRRGAWYVPNTDYIARDYVGAGFQGRAAMRDYLVLNPAVVAEIKATLELLASNPEEEGL